MSLPQVGETVELTLVERGGARFSVHVQRTLGSCVTLPAIAHEGSPLEVGERVTIRRGAEVQFGAVKGCDAEGRSVEIELAHPDRQRRKHTRGTELVQLRVATFSSGGRSEWKEAQATNLSAGGVCFSCDDDLKLGAEVAIELDLDGWRIEVFAAVVDVRRVRSAPGAPRRLVGVQFTSLTAEDRQVIVKHVHERPAKKASR